MLADKLIALRKKNVFLREVLAEKPNVPRRSVSKRGSTQSLSELDKIVLLGRVFGVNTDCILKDELEGDAAQGVDSLTGQRVNKKPSAGNRPSPMAFSLLVAKLMPFA